MDFSFNQYLVKADEPLLFHTGPRQMFPLIKDAVSKVLPPESLRWVSFGHVEADECGSMNQWLAVAPNATVGASATACMVSLGDLCDRPPEAFVDGGTHELGGHTMQWIDTPHVPHGWESGIIYDQTTKTLFCGDLFTHAGNHKAASTGDPIEHANAAQEMFGYWSLTPQSGARVRALADLDIATLALMHGPVYTSDTKGALHALADDIDKRVANGG
jgi:flavorubredoxin